jgi:creatinine amidohydrolase
VTATICDLTSPDVAGALARNPTVVLPFGSVEQHGPHLPCGTDTMAADLVARAVAARLDALLVPFGPYGITPIHAGHTGTISLSRRTFEALASDVCREVVRMGARALVLVNWHEGNTASLDAVATDLQDRLGVTFVVAQACYVAQRLYAEDGGELTHGGGIETLAVMAYDPSLLRLDRAGEASRADGAAELDDMRRSKEVYGFVTDVTELAGDGWYGDPGWATPARADGFAEKVAAEVVRQVERVLAARSHGKGGRA